MNCQQENEKKSWLQFDITLTVLYSETKPVNVTLIIFLGIVLSSENKCTVPSVCVFTYMCTGF